MRWSFGLLVLVACPSPPSEVREPAVVETPPALEIRSPDRGTFVAGEQVAVTGRAPGAVHVTVNGIGVDPARDGAFATTLTVPPGLTIIETHAIDGAGHDLRDVRSVLAGPFARSDGSKRAEIGAWLGRAGLLAVSKGLATSASAIDFSAAAQALNPVYERGGCLGARVEIGNVEIGKVDIALVPKRAAVETTVTVDDVVVRLDVRYKVACLGGNATMTVRTRARVRGDLGVALVGRRIHTSLPDPTVELDDFRIDLGSLPGPVEFLVRTVTRLSVEHAVTKAIATKLPPLADAKLAELIANPPAVSLLGHDLAVDVVPRKIDVAPSGLRVIADTALVVAGGRAGRYVTVPASSAGIANDPGDTGAWFAVDGIDQLLAGLWAAHAFERTLPRTAIGPLAILLDDKIRTIEVAFSLPPTVQGKLELAVGDMMITARDATGTELQRFAVSLRCGLVIKPGELALATTEPTVQAQLLAQSPAIARPLDGAAVEGIVKGAWSLVAGRIDEALAHIPIPGAGVALEIKAVTARDGLIVLDVAAKSP